MKTEKMKIFFVLIITLGMLYSCISKKKNMSNVQNDRKTNDMIDVKFDTSYYTNSLFIIPQNEKSLICKIEKNDVKELGSFPNPLTVKALL